MMMTKVLAHDSAKLWTIPPGEDFLGTLAKTLASETDLLSNPAALSNALIYVPNRRSARVLALKLFEQGGGKPILPPDIRALGDLETDEPPTGTEEAIAGLGPALSPGRRLGALASMVMTYYESRGLPLPPRSAVSAAQELSRLLDQAALSGEVDWSLLPNLVEDTDLAHHWRQSTEFLRIVTEYWPAWLAENGASDPFARRLAVAEAIAGHWQNVPPKGLVIIAGSTGATPAGRSLMQAVRSLPLGRVVFPGLDREMPANNWSVLRDSPDHPQHALSNTLRELGTLPDDVADWPIEARSQAAGARARLIHESLAPAGATANWLMRLDEIAGTETPQQFAAKAASGLSLITARSEEEEALFAALIMRETLEQAGETAAFVTPDAGMARRVSNQLKRWGVEVPISGGTPLLRTQAGRFLGLIADWVQDPAAPIPLISLLKHPFVDADPDALIYLETRILRGPRRWRDLASLSRFVSRHEGCAELLDQLTHLEPLATLASRPSLKGDVFANAVASLAQQLCETEDLPWRGDDGAAAAKLIETFVEVTTNLPPLSLEDAAEMLSALADLVTIPEAASHARLSIWGPLEARLQSADRIILAGLNEGVWPAQPSPDAFLPRKFRTQLGLATPESRLGLAAHDFAQLASAPDVTLLNSERRDDAPAVASRWVWRLQTLAQGALGVEGAKTAFSPDPMRDPSNWAPFLTDVPAAPRDPHLIPSPRPPLDARPRKLSVTRINLLQRDPYAIYCEKILDLQPLALLDEAPDARIRGTAIHEALEWLETALPIEKSPQRLAEEMTTLLRKAGEKDEILISDQALYLKASQWVIDWYHARQPEITGPVVLERRGELTFQIAGRSFTLSAVADRIETRPDGKLVIIDFKTGDPPSNRQITAGIEQQMPLQALIAEKGGFQGLRAKPVGELLYVSVKSKSYERVVEPPSDVAGPNTPSEYAADAQEGLIGLLTEFSRVETPYLSAPRPQFRSAYDSGYERLARRDEWGGDITDG
ncbi:MAG: double-strand break repair protein AddB [Pseudomonadota bacterium]